MWRSLGWIIPPYAGAVTIVVSRRGRVESGADGRELGARWVWNDVVRGSVGRVSRRRATEGLVVCGWHVSFPVLIIHPNGRVWTTMPNAPTSRGGARVDGASVAVKAVGTESWKLEAGWLKQERGRAEQSFLRVPVAS